MKNFSENEMLAVWRRRLGYDEARTDCTIERYDGHDINGRLREAMRVWYLRLLDTADPRLLPHGAVVPAAVHACGSRQLLIELPAGCRRPLLMHAARWERPAAPAADPRALAGLRRLASPFGWPDESCPAVCLLPDGRLVAAPLEEADAFTLDAVAEPADGSYVLDESLLETIPDHLEDLCYE